MIRDSLQNGDRYMLTVEALRAYGANVDEGITRCIGNEGFYLRMVNMALDMDTYDKLAAAVEAGDLTAAYEAAHSLKGVLGNVSLGPLSEEAAQISDLLKAGTQMDYKPRVQRLLELKQELDALRA